MQTSAIIALAQKKAPDWSTENLRELLNEIQNQMLMSKPLEFMRVYTTATGKDPTFTSSSTTFVYEISTANSFPNDAAFVEKVYTSDEDDVEDVIIYPATPSTVAKIVFKEAPSGDYYVRYYKKPTQITSTSVQLSVPVQYHMNTVFEGLCGMLEQIDSGMSQRLEKYERELLPKFWNAMNWKPYVFNEDHLRGY